MMFLCICMHGIVRSGTMANELNRHGIPAKARSLVHSINHYSLDDIIRADKIISVLSLQEHKELISDIPQQYHSKIIHCDVGIDRWGIVDHPELVSLCQTFLKATSFIS